MMPLPKSNLKQTAKETAKGMAISPSEKVRFQGKLSCPTEGCFH
jgi:hypothetical protein